MSSPNLAITHVAASQNNKEATINEAVDLLDRSDNSAAAVAMADAGVTLTTTQARQNGFIRATGAHTAVRKLTLPAGARRLAVRNETTGGFSVLVGYAAGSEVRIPPGGMALVHGDGTNCFGVGNGLTIAGYWPGAYTAAQPLLRFIVVVPFTLPVSLDGSRAASDVAADATSAFALTRNGSSIGSVNFASAATAGTFTFAAAVQFAVGDVLGLTAPNPPDATIEGLHLSLRGSFV
jgi:hypothetical protein